MAGSKLEYIWLDGHLPTQQMRSKTKVVENFTGKVEDAPMWSFDGSSTNQAEGGSSDLLLKSSFLRQNHLFLSGESLGRGSVGHLL